MAIETTQTISTSIFGRYRDLLVRDFCLIILEKKVEQQLGEIDPKLTSLNLAQLHLLHRILTCQRINYEKHPFLPIKPEAVFLMIFEQKYKFQPDVLINLFL